MYSKNELCREIVQYETGTQFLMHNNISTSCYANHWHSAVEIVMPIKNAYDLEINFQPYKLGEYDILIIPSGELHMMNSMQAGGQRIILQFSIEMLNAIHGFIDASYVYAASWLITPGNAPELHEPLKNILLEILEEYLNRNEYFEVAITQKIIGMTLLLARERNEYGRTHYEDLSRHKKHTERLNECLEYIERHYGEHLTLENVAQSIGYSKYHFSRWFQEHAAMSFGDYLTKVRINKAEALLISSELTMTEIALEAGFQSTNTFNRTFRKYNGCTPSEFRHLHYMRKQTEDIRESDKKTDVTPYTIKPFAPQGIPGHRICDAVYRYDDNGDARNPVIWADIPDPDVIRVNDTYYMTSTTMYFNPGIPVMKSYDLIHWEIVNYVYDILDSGDACALRNGRHEYGKGSWASSLRYNKGRYYVAVCSNNTQKTYIFRTGDIENGPWSRYELSGVYHDPSLLFDDDGRVYLVYGAGTIRVVELNEDASAVLPGGMNKVIIENANAGGDGGLPAEGSHIYKIGKWYYIFLIAWPPSGTKRRIQLCYRADAVDGAYEGRVVLDDDLGWMNKGAAQGGIVDTPQGDWYAMLFQDHDAVGRIPVLMPVRWEDGFPVFGIDGRVPLSIKPAGPQPASSQPDISQPAGPQPDISQPDISQPAGPQAEYSQPDTGGIIVSDEFNTWLPGKDHAAQNDISYRYGHGQPQEVPSDICKDDKQLLKNTRFEDGTAHWDVMEAADIEVTRDDCPGDIPVLKVSKRTLTGAGPKQVITGKVKTGGIYQAQAYVKYTTGPQEKIFNICIRNGTTWEGIRIIGTGKLTRGEWGLVHGTYTIPGGADLSESAIFIETPWKDKLKKETDLMDFYVRYVSLTEIPVVKSTTVMPGENDPPGTGPALAWQWNHNPDNNLWSLTDRPGFLRLKSAYLCKDLLDARNTLTQRTFGPACSAVAALETGGMKDGDAAGLAALQEIYGLVGVMMVSGEKYIVMKSADADNENNAHKEETHPHMLAGCRAFVPVSQERVYLRADFDFEKGDTARFYYSFNELTWHAIGGPVHMKYKLSHFTGYRFALFYYATQIPGGYADFDYFRPGAALAADDRNLTVLSSSFVSDTQALGIKGAGIRASLCMDALPEDNYKGIYLSLVIPDMLDVKEVNVCGGNISGDMKCVSRGRLLQIGITGDEVSFAHNVSDRFADISFEINRDINEDTLLAIYPEYIYIDGGSAAYLTHDTRALIHIYAPDTFTRGWYSQNSNN